jgi:hypothetical protein
MTLEQIQQLYKTSEHSDRDTRVAASALETAHEGALLHDAPPPIVDMEIDAIELFRVKAGPFQLSDEERPRSSLLGKIGFMAEQVRISGDALLGRKIAHAETSAARQWPPRRIGPRGIYYL